MAQRTQTLTRSKVNTAANVSTLEHESSPKSDGFKSKRKPRRVVKVKPDFYQEVTNTIIEALEQGVKPWVCPWTVKQASGIPSSFISHKPYSGMNILLLWASACQHRFGSSQWLTFKQAQAVGANVRKGEKGTRIFFYKMLEKESETAPEETENIPVLKTYTVFNVEQVEGLEALDESENFDSIAYLDDVDTFLTDTGANITYYGQKAFYRPSLDEIVVPPAHLFNSTADYYATTLHELTHWTGHKSRLDRDAKGRFGSKDYAFEELVAELGAAFLMAEFNVTGEVQHDSYIASWLEILKGDKRFIFKAASQASKAHQYLMNLRK